MPATARSDVPRHAVPIARAVAAAVAAAALAGCTVSVEGGARPAPVPPAPAATTPTLPARTSPGSDPAVYAEWMAAGWTPTPILPVTDRPAA